MEKIIHAMMELIASEVCGTNIDKSQYTLTDEEQTETKEMLSKLEIDH